jgi:hypothetical protein
MSHATTAKVQESNCIRENCIMRIFSCSHVLNSKTGEVDGLKKCEIRMKNRSRNWRERLLRKQNYMELIPS